MKRAVARGRRQQWEFEAHEIAIQAFENANARVIGFLAAIAAESILGTAFRLVLLVVPPPFYFAIFAVCWDCYVRVLACPIACPCSTPARIRMHALACMLPS